MRRPGRRPVRWAALASVAVFGASGASFAQTPERGQDEFPQRPVVAAPRAKDPAMAIDVQRARATGFDEPLRLARTAERDLLAASAAGDVAKVKELMSKGARLDLRDEMGHLPLVTAAARGHFDVVRALVDAGADADAKAGNGHAALGIAKLRGHLSVVDALLRAGALVDLRSDNGQAPLLNAVQGQHASVAARGRSGCDVDRYLLTQSACSTRVFPISSSRF